MLAGLLARFGRAGAAPTQPTVPEVDPAKAPAPPPNRTDLLLSLFDARGHGLEIGPSFNPLLPKSQGYDVKVLDHASTEDLVNKYRDAAVDVSKIETVDYVSDGGSLVDAVGERGCFDFIVASHVIEHTVNLLGFLRDCEQLLKSDGVLVLAVPDKRCAFDMLRPVSSTGDVLQADVDGRKLHSPGALFDEIAYNCLRAGSLTWSRDDVRELAFAAPLQAAKGFFESVRREPVFHDIHAWQFTPSSFRLIANDLHDIGYVGLREAKVAQGAGEFFITLSRAAPGPAQSRMQLAQAAIAESREIKVLGG